MGAPKVIPTPTKSYVAINSIGADKSLPPTLFDLGRVSSIAAAVTLSRASNFVTRNNSTQNTRSIPLKERPISVVLGYSNSNTLHDNKAATLSVTHQPNSTESHVNRRDTNENQLSISAIETSSMVDNNPDRRHDSTSHTKQINQESTLRTPRMVTSPGASRVDNQKNISVPEKAQMNLSTQYHTSQSTNFPPQKPILMPVQLHSQETEAEHPINQHVRTHTQNTTQLPNQQSVSLLTAGMGTLPSHLSLSIAVQLQQQNQQLRSENVLLQKQLSLFRQLMKNPQRLNQVLTRLEQRVH